MNTTNDLSSLRRPAKRESGGRKAGPLVILLAFVVGVALLFILFFGERLRPRVTVTAVPALLLESERDSTETAPPSRPGTMVAQASGWIEPDPYAIRVPVKTDGFVENVYVLEGESVRAGDLLATLDPTNQQLRVERLEAALNEARAALSMQEESIRLANAATAAAQARSDEAADRAERIATLGDSDIAPVERIAADRAAAESAAALESAQAKAASEEARADQLRAAHQRQEAELKQARIDLDRTRITAPVDGVVLDRFAAPGMKRMAGMDDPDSANIVSLYDPAKLQVRVDVPLSAIGQIETGMAARIVTGAFPNRAFTGTVTRITGEADIARNTLQVKVAIHDPDPRMRPEMLCRAEFLGRAAAAPGGSSSGTHALWIPAGAVVSEQDGTATVWVVDPVEETAATRDLTLGAGSRDGLRPVLDGLRAGERVVTDGADRLKPGSLVAIKKGSPQ